MNLNVLQNYHHFENFYALILKQQKTNIFVIFREQHEKAAVLSMTKIFSMKNQFENEIKRDENAYFFAVEFEKRAISTKFIIISKLNQNFIADNKL